MTIKNFANAISRLNLTQQMSIVKTKMPMVLDEMAKYEDYRYNTMEEMAERGFLTIAFDPSFTGKSDGEPRYMNSPDINVEDFQSAVDFLSNLENVDSEKISIIGICGWGGMALQTACIDTRIKATICSTMYNMSRVACKGYFDEQDNEESRYNARVQINNQRTEDIKTGEYKLAGGLLHPMPEDAPQFLKDYYAYYKTPRGYHSRSLKFNVAVMWNLLET